MPSEPVYSKIGERLDRGVEFEHMGTLQAHETFSHILSEELWDRWQSNLDTLSTAHTHTNDCLQFSKTLKPSSAPTSGLAKQLHIRTCSRMPRCPSAELHSPQVSQALFFAACNPPYRNDSRDRDPPEPSPQPHESK